MFDLERVSVTYKEMPVLKEISLSIRSGEKIAIIGPSGAGKTTLLRKLYEIEPDQSSFIHQHDALIPQLSTFHNVYAGRLDHHSVAYNLLNLAWPREREVAEVRKLLSDLGMEEKLFEKVAALSGGQRQRVSVARAIYKGSSVLLADEPVSSIDPHQAEAVLNLLQAAAETVILSLHTVQLAVSAFERIIGLRDGRIFFDLSGEMVDRGRLEELFAPC